MQISYRPDIDGLRAVAVLTVLVFHAFPSVLPAGFIGVDIFFVISGYLISSIILSQLVAKQFSFIDFYSRRIRRIFPSLILVLATSLIGAWYLLLPGAFKSLGLHVAGGSAFASNFLLFSEAGYFDIAAGEKPMLHLWSLSIEEQFYLVWPVLLAVFLRFFRSPLPLIVLGGIASFLHGLALLETSRSSAFYLPSARFWELMAGALIAYLHLLGPNGKASTTIKASQATRRLARTISDSSVLQFSLSLVGAGLLCAGLALVRTEIGFPGWWALLPVGGASFIIAAGPHGLMSRLVLNKRALVQIGLISYPLYLWHWPLLSIAELAAPEALTVFERLLLLAASFILAWATYSFIEQPIRRGAHGAAKASILICGMAVVGGMGWTIFKKDGYSAEMPSLVRQVLEFSFDYKKAYRHGQCFHERTEIDKHFETCTNTPVNPDAPRVFLWGDSHAAHLYPGLSAVLGDRVALSQITTSECAPLLLGEAIDPLCYRRNTEVLAQIERERPDVLILAGNWGIKGEFVTRYLTAVLQRLKSLNLPRIIVVGQHPTWNSHVSQLLAQRIKEDPFNRLKSRLSGLLRNDPQRQDDLLRPLVEEVGGMYIAPYDVLCNEDGCLAVAGETPATITTWDDAHLAMAGSRLMAERLAREIP